MYYVYLIVKIICSFYVKNAKAIIKQCFNIKWTNNLYKFWQFNKYSTSRICSWYKTQIWISTKIYIKEYKTIILSSRHLSLTSPLYVLFRVLTQPEPYRATTCRWRELISESHTYLFVHKRKWRVSPGEGSAQCRGHLRVSANKKDDTRQAHTHSFQQGEYEMILWRPNDIREPWGPKVSWHLSYRWRKTPKKPHPGNLSRPGILPVVLYGSQTWSWLREEHRLRVLVNKVRRKIFGGKRDEITGEWRKLHNA